MPKALIFGITGMDGSHMADLLLSKGYIVYGTIRRTSNSSTSRINHILDKIMLLYCDVTDTVSVFKNIINIKPNIIFNFAAQSHVQFSSDISNYTFQVNSVGILNILEAVKTLEGYQKVKVYHASTSEMYGNNPNIINESTPMNPISIYGISKLTAYNICNMYNKAFGMFIVSAILFNHESNRRGDDFVTKKIINYVKNYQNNRKNQNNRCYGQEYEPLLPLKLGELDSYRDWGYAPEYMEAVLLMMEQKEPKNYIVATGKSHSVRQFVMTAFSCIGIEIHSNDKKGLEEKLIDDRQIIVVEIDYANFRDIDINYLAGDPSLIEKELGWKSKVDFKELIIKMLH